jgi:hypothetical protein
VIGLPHSLLSTIEKAPPGSSKQGFPAELLCRSCSARWRNILSSAAGVVVRMFRTRVVSRLLSACGVPPWNEDVGSRWNSPRLSIHFNGQRSLDDAEGFGERMVMASHLVACPHHRL